MTVKIEITRLGFRILRVFAAKVFDDNFDRRLQFAEKYNGFMSKEVLHAFIRYGKKMVDCFGDKVKYWITFNEQNLYHGPEAFRISGYVKGNQTDDELYQILHNIMVGHAAICNYIHETTDAKIGGMLAYSEVYPATCHPIYLKQMKLLRLKCHLVT